MNTIEDLFTDIATNDLRGDYVAPKPKRAKDLGSIIATKSCSELSNLADEDRTGGTEPHLGYNISARKGAFVSHAKLTVDKLTSELKKAGAKRIDIAFHNTTCKDNEWGDLVRLAVRFVR